MRGGGTSWALLYFGAVAFTKGAQFRKGVGCLCHISLWGKGARSTPGWWVETGRCLHGAWVRDRRCPRSREVAASCRINEPGSGVTWQRNHLRPWVIIGKWWLRKIFWFILFHSLMCKSLQQSCVTALYSRNNPLALISIKSDLKK